MGAKGIHMGDNIPMIEKDHESLANSINELAKKLIFDDLDDVFKKTKDARVAGFIVKLQKTMANLLPDLVEKAFDKWEDEEEDLIHMLKRNKQDMDEAVYAETKYCMDHIKGYYKNHWIYFNDYKVKIRLGEPIDIDYLSTTDRIKVLIVKFIEEIENDCQEYERKYKAIFYEAEENRCIYYSFKFIREALSYGNLFDELTSELDGLFK